MNDGIYLTRQELQQVRSRASLPRVRRWIDDLLLPLAARATSASCLSLLPAESGADFVCPTHNSDLEADPNHPERLRCFIDGEIFTGPSRIGGRRLYQNEDLANGACAKALLAAILPESDVSGGMANAAREILDAYSRVYASWKVTGGDRFWQRGRAMSSPLMETTWILSLVWAADLLKVAGFASECDLKGWGEGLFLPCAEFLNKEICLIHNIRCWINSAVYSIGALVDSSELRDASLKGEFGFYAQVYRGTTPSGEWFETSPQYQLYCLQALLIQSEAAIRAGENLYGTGHLAAIGEAAARYIRRDLRLIPLNDTPWDVLLHPFLCPTIMRRWPNGNLAPLAAQRIDSFHAELSEGCWKSLVHVRNLGRFAADILLEESGVPKVEADPAPESIHLKERQQTLFLRDSGRGHQLAMECGPKLASHMHYERLSACVYFADLPFLIDRGSTAYHLSSYNFYRYAPAHNTLALSEWHHLHTSAARVIESAPNVIAAEVEIHQGFMLHRRMELAGDEVSDELTLSARTPVLAKGRTADLYFHFGGNPTGFEVMTVETGEFERPYFGYDHFSNIRELQPISGLEVDLGTRRVRLSFEQLPYSPRFFLADSPGCGTRIDISVSALIVRCPVQEVLHFKMAYSLLP